MVQPSFKSVSLLQWYETTSEIANFRFEKYNFHIESEIDSSLLVTKPTCNLDSFGVAVLPEGLVSASDEAGEEATGLHHDLAQGYIAGGVWQHRITLDNIISD